jgi:hypothetical protein
MVVHERNFTEIDGEQDDLHYRAVNSERPKDTACVCVCVCMFTSSRLTRWLIIEHSFRACSTVQGVGKQRMLGIVQ